jgi:hypothetical protein
VLGLCLTSSGCQSPQQAFVPQAIGNPKNGKIYVYWPGQRWGERSGRSPEVRLNGVPVGLLRYKSYLELETAAGTYELRITGEGEESDWDGGDRAFTTPLAAGEIKYVRLLIKYDQSTNSLGHGLLDYVVSFLPRAEQEARLEMHGLRRIED